MNTDNLTGCPSCGGMLRALKEIAALPSVRQDEACCIALGAIDAEPAEQPDGPPKKMIIVTTCDDCPYNGGCPAWKKLTSEQRVTLTLSIGLGAFILKGCHLPNAEPTP
jgi:hypothetical protein